MSKRPKSRFKKTKKLYKEGKRKKWKLEDAEEEHDRSVSILEETRDLKKKVQKIKNYPFLRNVNYNPSQFKVSSTLTLTQNIDYSRVFSIYQEIRKDKRLRRLSNIGEFVEGINTIGVKKTSQVYEYWTLFAVYKTLVDLGFKEDSKNSLIEMIDQESLTPGLAPETYVDLNYNGSNEKNKSLDFLDGTMLRIHYEKRFYVDGNPNVEKARPDITIEVYQNERNRKGRLLMDAKYKTRESCKNEEFKKGSTNKNGVTQAEKYQNKKLNKGRIERGMGAIFLHIDRDEKDFDLTRCIQGATRWHGHFSVLPDDTGRLETLLEEFLRHRVRQVLSRRK